MTELTHSLNTAGANRAERFALQAAQAGAIAIVLVVSTLSALELDRFFVPLELALHLTAAAAGLLAIRAISRAGMTRFHLRLARISGGAQRCEHARAAHALFPSAEAAAAASRGCGE